MRSQWQQAEHTIRRAADKEFHGNCCSSILRVLFEAASSQRLRVKKRTRMNVTLRIHKMEAHRRRVRMLAVLRRGVIRRKKSRARHAQMERPKHRSTNQQS